MIEAKLTALLKTVLPRVYPLVAPATAQAPFIIYTRASTPRIRDMAGPTGIAQPAFNVDVYAVGYLVARGLADQVRAVLDGYSDAELLNVSLENEFDLSDLTSSPDLSRVHQEFRILHDEKASAS